MLDANFMILVNRNTIYVFALDIENDNNGSSAELEGEAESEQRVNEDGNLEEGTNEINSMLLN